jgi:hypothetical protein
MWRVVSIVALIVVAAAAGFFVPRFFQLPNQIAFRFKFPDQDVSTKPIAPGVEYACSAITQSEVYENREDGPTGNAGAGKWGDEVALKVSSDGKGISIILPFDITNGATVSPDPIPIVSRDDNGIVASRLDALGVVTLVVDVTTLKAVFSYSGEGMTGIRGRSILIACR